MKSVRSIIVIIAVVTALVSAVLMAQQAQAPKPAEPKYTKIDYTADASSYKWDGEDRILVLKGNVKFVHGDTVILADKVDYRESTRIATATGNLKIYDDQNTITGETCTINFKEKKGTLTGNIILVAKPKSKPTTTTEAANSTKPKPITSEWKDEVTITTDKIDFYYKEKRAVVQSPLKLVQKSRTVTADSGTYLSKEETIQLAGNVKGNDEKDKHSFAAPKVTISLKKDNEWIEAEKATGSFYVKDEEDQSKPADKQPDVKPADKVQVIPVKQ